MSLGRSNTTPLMTFSPTAVPPQEPVIGDVADDLAGPDCVVAASVDGFLEAVPADDKAIYLGLRVAS